MNKGLKIVLVLSLISSGMAVALAGVNSITAPTIAKNNEQKEKEAKEKIFSECEFVTADFKGNNYSYLKSIDCAKKNNETQGYIFKCEGKNAYGGIEMMLGISSQPEIALKTFVITSNTESYAGTLEDNYISTVLSGDRDYTDVSCGATYGAKLIKGMIDEGLKEVELQ